MGTKIANVWRTGRKVASLWGLENKLLGNPGHLLPNSLLVLSLGQEALIVPVTFLKIASDLFLTGRQQWSDCLEPRISVSLSCSSL